MNADYPPLEALARNVERALSPRLRPDRRAPAPWRLCDAAAVYLSSLLLGGVAVGALLAGTQPPWTQGLELLVPSLSLAVVVGYARVNRRALADLFGARSPVCVTSGQARCTACWPSSCSTSVSARDCRSSPVRSG
jgi:hypothetical protein